MRTAFSRLAAVFSLLFCAALASCHDAPRAGSSTPDMCAQGGAFLSASSNECTCPDAQHWTGSRCEATLGPAAALAEPGEAKAVAKPTPPPPHADDPAPPAEAAAAAEEPAAPAFDLRTVCKAAGAHFDAKDAYCHCPGGDVLVGASCRAFAGQVNELACAGVQRPGHWLKSHCDCAPGKDFIPGRGGCVPRKALSTTTGRRICEASLNRGKWDAARSRCDCGAGRVWNGAVCDLTTTLPSREVCESGSNHGRWNKEQKRCSCPAGRLWLDQSCRLAAAVDPMTACTSEANGGTWIAAESRCACPKAGRVGVWGIKDKTCR